MRICFVMINCNRRDGHSRPVNEVAERLANRGHEIHLLARNVEDIDLGLVKWRRVRGPGFPEVAHFTAYALQTNHRLRHHDYDIVHSIGCNTYRANVITIQNVQPAKSQALNKLMADEQISAPRRLTRYLHERVTTAAEYRAYELRSPAPLFLPVSAGVERELRTHFDIGSSPTRIIPNAADSERFRPISTEDRNTWRTSNGLSESDIVVIFSGGEWMRKGLESAIQAVSRLTDPRIKLFVAGQDPNHRRYERLVDELNIASRVVFGGFRADIATALASSDIFLFPSYYEAFSLATIEAAAAGLPVVTTRINGSEDFIRPGVTGEFITHDPADIANVIGHLASNPTLCREMGERARALVISDYNWDRITDLTEAAYQSVLS